MSDVLRGIKVLVTRPAQQADDLCNKIESSGGQAIQFPVIEIQPPDKKESVVALLNDLSRFHIGIFISRNAVQWALMLSGKTKTQLQRLILIATGPATAKQLQQAGISNYIHASGQVSSETLLELPELQEAEVKGKSIIIFRGQGGREILTVALKERGANIEYAEVYKRIRPYYNDEYLDNIWTNEEPDVIVVTSGEALQNLLAMLNSRQKEVLLDKQLVTISSRIVDLARETEFRNEIILADETSDTGILNAIIKTVGVAT